MKKSMDVLFVNPGSRQQVYQNGQAKRETIRWGGAYVFQAILELRRWR